MGPKSEMKPINVVANYIVRWIRANSGESAPFESFELAGNGGRNIGQKDVERWIFNCNYLYYRLGDLLLGQEGPVDVQLAAPLMSKLSSSFKTIKDSNPLNLRSKQSVAIEREFLKDWPPLCAGSRNTRALFESRSVRFLSDYAGEQSALREMLAAFSNELAEEEQYYGRLSCTGVGRVERLRAVRAVLPIFCIKEINPLFSLLLWDDEVAVQELIECIVGSFEISEGVADHGLLSDYARSVLAAQSSYIRGLEFDGPDLKRLPVPALGAILEDDGFSLNHVGSAQATPAWLQGKAQLLWNILVCSVFGPLEMVGARSSSMRGSSTSGERFPPRPESTVGLRGEVLLRRRYLAGHVETIDRLRFESVQAEGLWKVIGSKYDSSAPLPDSTYRAQYRALGALYTGSAVYDARGEQVEGHGDSRFHVELSISMTGEEPRIVLRDLGSKNGTCVERSVGGASRFYAFGGRRHIGAQEWARRFDAPIEQVETVDSLELMRGDIIHLSGSSYEVV